LAGLAVPHVECAARPAVASQSPLRASAVHEETSRSAKAVRAPQVREQHTEKDEEVRQLKKQIDDPKVQGKYFDNAIPKDLVDYGMIPEFVGRFPVIVSTKGLDIEDLVDILTEPKNSIMKQYRCLFAMDDVDFHVTKAGLEEIAKTAFSRGTGARGLRSITDNVLMETQYVVPSEAEVHTVYVDERSVRGETKPILLKDPEMSVERYEKLLQQGGDCVDDTVVVSIDTDDLENDREEAA